MGVIAELAVNIVAKTNQFTHGLREASTNLKKFEVSFGKSTEAINKWHAALDKAAWNAKIKATLIADSAKKAESSWSKAWSSMSKGSFGNAGPGSLTGMKGLGTGVGAAIGVGVGVFHELDKGLQDIIERAAELQSKGILTEAEIARAKEYAGLIGGLKGSFANARAEWAVNLADTAMGELGGGIPKFGEGQTWGGSSKWNPFHGVQKFAFDSLVNSMITADTGPIMQSQITAKPGSHVIPNSEEDVIQQAIGSSLGKAIKKAVSGLSGGAEILGGLIGGGADAAGSGIDSAGSWLRRNKAAIRDVNDRKLRNVNSLIDENDKQINNAERRAGLGGNSVLLGNTSQGYQALNQQMNIEKDQLMQLKASREHLKVIADSLKGGSDPFVVSGA